MVISPALMTSDQQFWWTWWVRVAGTVATLLAVLVALFGEMIRARLFPPKLRLSLVSSTGVKSDVNIGPAPGTSTQVLKARYYHVQLQNLRPSRPATETAIYLIGLDEPGPNQQLQTKWEGAVPLKWPFMDHLKLPLRQTVGPTTMCDLCHVVQGQGLSIEPAVRPLALDPFITRRPIGTSVDMTVRLQARGAQGDSPVTAFRIAWNGQWSDGDQEMAKDLIIQQV